jgi:hypothetical protein
MTFQNHNFLDTDLQIHRLSPDEKVQEAALLVFNTEKPTAMSAFSLVELKGNYISSFILLRRKISDSDSLREAYSRIQNSGGRKPSLMLAQLFLWLGGIDYPVNPWNEARHELLTHIDAQIVASWEGFKSSVDMIIDDFDCTRASEEPQDDGDRWRAPIAQCRRENTKCTIVPFMRKFYEQLNNLASILSALDSSQITDELNRINRVIKQTLKNDEFPWEGVTCRQVGDLLIGLQSKAGKKLISSNYREHSHMCKPLGYEFQNFPISEIRSK